VAITNDLKQNSTKAKSVLLIVDTIFLDLRNS